jgi:hypothetical protein
VTEHRTTKQATKYTITATHRITGKSRTTIQKHLKKGKLSYSEDEEGVKWIDASELIRVYGDDCRFEREEGAQANEHVRPILPDTVRTDLHILRTKLDTLEEERRRERQQLQSQIDQLQETLKLSQEGANRALLLLDNRSGGGEWREAIARLETKFTEHDKAAVEEAKRKARAELLSKPWWRLVWERGEG